MRNNCKSKILLSCSLCESMRNYSTLWMSVGWSIWICLNMPVSSDILLPVAPRLFQMTAEDDQVVYDIP